MQILIISGRENTANDEGIYSTFVICESTFVREKLGHGLILEKTPMLTW